jgi:pyrroloquinoline quinone (PQQ) biosynthesis protein C
MKETEAIPHEYLRVPPLLWLQRIKSEVIDPLRIQTESHPFVRGVQNGTIPKFKIVRMLSDLLWIITTTAECVAAMASRCPRYDHELKAKLLENAYVERDHPHALARAVTALGGEGDRILSGSDHSWEGLPIAGYLRELQLCLAFERPWIIGIAGFGVGIECVAPALVRPIWKGLDAHYGLKEEHAQWFVWHAGVVEQEHGNAGLMILDRYVRHDDEATQAECRHTIEKVMRLVGITNQDAYLAYEEG